MSLAEPVEPFRGGGVFSAAPRGDATFRQTKSNLSSYPRPAGGVFRSDYSMSYSPESYSRDFYSADASLDTRSAFLRKVYAHVFGAVLAMVALISLICTVEPLANALMGLAFSAWWVILVGFIAISFIAERMAYSQASRGVQYAGLGLYVLAQSIIITPMVYALTSGAFGIANGTEIVLQAAGLTLLIFGGLTAVVFLTKADFTFLRGFLAVAGFGVLGLIIVSLVFGVHLGTWFSVGMVVLLALTILYETSAIRENFPPDAYVAAALALFGSISTMFFYILRLLISLNSD